MEFEEIIALRKKYRNYNDSILLEYRSDVGLTVDTQVCAGEVGTVFTILNRRNGNCQCEKSVFKALDIFAKFVNENE